MSDAWATDLHVFVFALDSGYGEIRNCFYCFSIEYFLLDNRYKSSE